MEPSIPTATSPISPASADPPAPLATPPPVADGATAGWLPWVTDPPDCSPGETCPADRLPRVNKHVTVVDARMGRGKSSAAIRYMNERKDEKCFLYITPYLTEVERVCEKCDFDEPNCDYMSKSAQLKDLMRRRCNIASTHSLFSLMDKESLALAKENGYSLIVDESLDVIHTAPVSATDKDIILDRLADVDETGVVSWRDADYEGKFDGYKAMADAGTLYCVCGSFFEIMAPHRFLAFDEIFMMTYLFDGQLQKAYMDYFGFTYDVVGIEQDDQGFKFSSRPDDPPEMNYFKFIHIVGLSGKQNAKMNEVGQSRTALSANWFKTRGRSDPDIKRLRSNMHYFFHKMTESRARERLWTTFKLYSPWLYGDRNRYSSDFLSLNARATNAYRGAISVAYLVNRFVDPNILKFFATRDIKIDPDLFALGEMLQFIWRSAIRDNRPINLYIPSSRMRGLLVGWMKDVSQRGETREI